MTPEEFRDLMPRVVSLCSSYADPGSILLVVEHGQLMRVVLKMTDVVKLINTGLGVFRNC